MTCNQGNAGLHCVIQCPGLQSITKVGNAISSLHMWHNISTWLQAWHCWQQCHCNFCKTVLTAVSL